MWINESTLKQIRLHLSLGPLVGTTFGGWWRILRENRFAVDPPYWSRAAGLTAASAINSGLSRYENWRHGKGIAGTEISPPLFIIGIGRSGTTLLQYLFASDKRFAFPNLYQVQFPHHFLTTETLVTRLSNRWVRGRRVQDRVEISWFVPGEDEIALLGLCGHSPVLSRVFPRREMYYQRFLDFSEASPDQLDQWFAALDGFLRKLTYYHGRPLILKSPAHTLRLQLLARRFPDARFIYLHRHPEAVLRSALHARQVGKAWTRLQWELAGKEEELLVLQRYEAQFQGFFASRGSIPRERLVIVRYEDLVRDMLGELRRIYELLALPDFALAEPSFKAAMQARSGYRVNRHPPLDEPIRRQLQERCADAYVLHDDPEHYWRMPTSGSDPTP